MDRGHTDCTKRAWQELTVGLMAHVADWLQAHARNFIADDSLYDRDCWKIAISNGGLGGYRSCGLYLAAYNAGHHVCSSLGWLQTWWWERCLAQRSRSGIGEANERGSYSTAVCLFTTSALGQYGVDCSAVFA